MAQREAEGERERGKEAESDASCSESDGSEVREIDVSIRGCSKGREVDL